MGQKVPRISNRLRTVLNACTQPQELNREDSGSAGSRAIKLIDKCIADHWSRLLPDLFSQKFRLQNTGLD